MKMTIHRAVPIPLDEYQALAELLRHEAMSKPHVQKILKADPKFAAWFKATKS